MNISLILWIFLITFFDIVLFFVSLVKFAIIVNIFSQWYFSFSGHLQLFVGFFKFFNCNFIFLTFWSFNLKLSFHTFVVHVDMSHVVVIFLSQVFYASIFLLFSSQLLSKTFFLVLPKLFILCERSPHFLFIWLCLFFKIFYLFLKSWNLIIFSLEIVFHSFSLFFQSSDLGIFWRQMKF